MGKVRFKYTYIYNESFLKVSFSWAVLYLTFSAIPLVFTANHGFNIQQNGAVFAGEECAGTYFC